MILFMRHIIRQLDKEIFNWNDRVVFLFDNAAYQASPEFQEYLKKLNLQVIYFGPYSFLCSVCEPFYGAIKSGDLNKESNPTGKKVM